MRSRLLIPALMALLALCATQPSAQTVARDNGRPSAYDRRSSTPSAARTVVVPSDVAWSDTGLHVAKNQWLRFAPSGQIRLSVNREDSSTAGGARNSRLAQAAPIPTIPVGALIGRINNGKPFAIGDTTQAFQVPSNGTLFLGVNDDQVLDNDGHYVVKVWDPEKLGSLAFR